MPTRMENYLFNNCRGDTLSGCCWWIQGGEETSISDWDVVIQVMKPKALDKRVIYDTLESRT